MRVEDLSTYGRTFDYMPRKAMIEQMKVMFSELTRKFGLFGTVGFRRYPRDLPVALVKNQRFIVKGILFFSSFFSYLLNQMACLASYPELRPGLILPSFAPISADFPSVLPNPKEHRAPQPVLQGPRSTILGN